MTDNPKPIDDARWLWAHEGETNYWSSSLSKSRAELEQSSGWNRHAPVMALDPSIMHFFPMMMIIDIGGGPVSMLLRCPRTKYSTVVDPLDLPKRELEAYEKHNIFHIHEKAEDYLRDIIDTSVKAPLYDEAWIYNCLQHVQDPEYILRNIGKVAKALRISEPCNVGTHQYHPHSFSPEWLYSVLDDISDYSVKKRVEYDFPYCGGYFRLK